MPKKTYRIWRIDPVKKAIAPLLLDASKRDYALHLQRLVRAEQLGHRMLVDIGGTKLCVAADARAEEGQVGWRLRGVKGITASIGVLFGQGSTGGLISAPCDREWIDRHLVWTSPEETDDADADDVDGTLVMVSDEEPDDGA